MAQLDEAGLIRRLAVWDGLPGGMGTRPGRLDRPVRTGAFRQGRADQSEK